MPGPRLRNERTRPGPARPVKALLSLEAVLIFPLVLLLLFTFLGAIQGEHDAMILTHALDQTAREVALLLPLADLAEQYLDPASWIRELVPDEFLAGVALDGLADMAATTLASPFLLRRLDVWAKATAESRQVRQPSGARRMVVDFDEDRKSIWLCLSFERSNLFVSDWCQIRARVPVWNTHSFTQTGEGTDPSQDPIWSLSNFERGLAFRKMFGGHLPQFYPVIAAWNGHEALAVKSMDWTAPTWSSPAAVEGRIDGFVSDLANFEGAGGEGPSPGEIGARRLILVIPGNEIAWKTEALLGEWRRKAGRAGVTLDIREYGISRVHQAVD